MRDAITPKERAAIQDALISAIKELGEIAECTIKENDRPDHWKEELGDLCGLAIRPLLDIAGTNFDDACMQGWVRQGQKIEEAANDHQG